MEQLRAQTGDTYNDVIAFAPDPETVQIVFDVGNQPILARFWRLTDGGEKFFLDLEEVAFVPSIGNVVGNAAGVQFRSSVAGKSAVVIAKRTTRSDIRVQPGIPYDGLVSTSGTLNPPGGGGGGGGGPTLIFQHNGTTQATENTLDFEDTGGAGGVTFAVSDDAPNARAKVTGTCNGVAVSVNGFLQATEPGLNFGTGGGTSPPAGSPQIQLTWSAVDNPGAKRVDITPSLSGLATLIYDSGYLGGAQASFDVTPLVQNPFSVLLGYWIGRSDAVATFVRIGLRFNNDSTTSYDNDTNFISQAQAVTAVDVAGNETSLVVGEVAAASVTAGLPGQGQFAVAGYTSTVFHKLVTAHGVTLSSGAALRAEIGGGRWGNTAAVSRVTLFPLSGNWIAGSRLVLYAL